MKQNLQDNRSLLRETTIFAEKQNQFEERLAPQSHRIIDTEINALLSGVLNFLID